MSSKRTGRNSAFGGGNDGGATAKLISLEALGQIGYGMRQDGDGAIVVQEDGAVQVGPFVLTPIGLKIEREVTEGEWQNFYAVIRRIRSSLNWILGDWLAYGAHRWGEKYEALAGFTGLKEKTLREYAYVARHVELSSRLDKLSFGHHQEVARFDADAQRQWLSYAAEHKLSVKQLRAALQGQALPSGRVSVLERAATQAARARAVAERARRSKKPAVRDGLRRLAQQELDYWRDLLESLE